MKAKIEVKFPCGYEFKADLEANAFSGLEFDMDKEDFKNCPLHGKKCKK